jgi:hypothetical protein
VHNCGLLDGVVVETLARDREQTFANLWVVAANLHPRKSSLRVGRRRGQSLLEDSYDDGTNIP